MTGYGQLNKTGKDFVTMDGINLPFYLMKKNAIKKK
jgi:hypothetical protein